jgi:membrane associated rhomboid family serine protease
MFLPIGLDETETRRTPWVSLALIAINVLVFLVMSVGGQQEEIERQVDSQGREVLRYLAEHPYLQVPPQLAPHLDDRDRRNLEDARGAIVRSGRMPADWEVQEQQGQLDQMVRDLFAKARSSPVQRWGLVPAHPDALHFLTSMFVHANIWHLLGNMVFLYLTGFFVEDAYGRALYTALYFLSGIAAAAVHIVHNPGSEISTVGASGAIAGIMGAFLVRYARRRIVFLWLPLFPFPVFVRRIRVPAFVYLPFWFLGQIFLSSISGESSGVAVWAHIGGFIFGFLAALLIAAFGIETKYIDPAIEREVGRGHPPGLGRLAEPGARGDSAPVRRAIMGATVPEDPRNLEALRYGWSVALAGQDPGEIAREASKLLEAYLACGQDDLAAHLIREAAVAAPSALPPRFLLRAGDFLARRGDGRQALEMYDRLIHGFPEDPSVPRALLQSADLIARGGDSFRARQLLEQAKNHKTCGPEWRPVIEQRIAQLEQAGPARPTGYRGSRPTSG